ncbi:MAG: hypothetical protein AAGD96_04020 [Chloroflexota bacterium]
MQNNKITKSYVTIFFISALGILLVNVHPWLGQNLVADEIYHQRQIEMFQAGTFDQQPELTTLPGYHWVVFSLTNFLNPNGLIALRIAGSLIGLAAVFLFDLAYRCLHGASNGNRTLQVLFLPILFPFYFLLYTDAFSITIYLLMILFWLRGNHLLAAIAGAAAFYVRQPIIVFVFLIVLIDWLSFAIDQDKFNLTKVGEWLRYGWAYIVLAAGVGIFYIVNGGFAVGDADAHPGGFVGWHNVTFSAWMACIILWPISIGRVRQAITSMWTDRPVRLLVFVGACVFLILSVITFEPSHPYNALPGTLHNAIILMATETTWGKLLLGIPILLIGVGMSQINLSKKSHYAIYLVWVASLIPFWLVEPRYSIPAFITWLLFVPPLDKPTEDRLLINSIFLSLILFAGILLGVMFP